MTAHQPTLPLDDPERDAAARVAATLQQSMPPTREEALTRLASFVPRSGGHYAKTRNYDFGPGDRSNVSVLSPYIRTRLVTEAEVATSVLEKFAPSTAQKFIQEVCWRTYWKGWLEHRPSVWHTYLSELAAARTAAETDASLRDDIMRAEAGDTGIDAFDSWARELTATNYLHNHARMWFASIWIFTLRLPWQLGADFFYQNLHDGDPASNTLSWRWVAGLHTAGKTYAARASNIAKYTEGRFHTDGQLSVETQAIDGPPNPPAGDLPELTTLAPDIPCLILLHEDDLGHQTLDVPKRNRAGTIAIDTTRCHDGYGDAVRAFRAQAIGNALRDAGSKQEPPVDATDPEQAAEQIRAAMRDADAETVLMPFAPVGHNATALAPVLHALRQSDVQVQTLTRSWDAQFWPHATRGFFKLKDKIPKVLGQVL